MKRWICGPCSQDPVLLLSQCIPLYSKISPPYETSSSLPTCRTNSTSCTSGEGLRGQTAFTPHHKDVPAWIIADGGRVFLAAFLINKLIRPLMSLSPRSAATSFHRNFSISKPVSTSPARHSLARTSGGRKGVGSRPPLGHRSHAAHVCTHGRAVLAFRRTARSHRRS